MSDSFKVLPIDNDDPFVELTSNEAALLSRLDRALDLLLQHGDRMIEFGNKTLLAGDRVLEMQQKAHKWQDYARAVERASGLSYDKIQDLRREHGVD